MTLYSKNPYHLHQKYIKLNSLPPNEPQRTQKINVSIYMIIDNKFPIQIKHIFQRKMSEIINVN
jgi:hypothetical protein